MNHAISLLFAALLLMSASSARAVETASYETVLADGDFELREYAAQIRVETVVEADFKQAGNQAFRRLFDYISGANRSPATAAGNAGGAVEISMTAPVTQSSAKQIAMTSPVSQERFDDGSWQVGFLLPASFTPETAPLPTNPAVFLRTIPAQKMASIRYTGTWSSENYSGQLLDLENWIARQGLTVIGEPTWARYDSPFKPWFLRRNEILIAVE